ncbi:MAG: hypothetical protein MHM6MM_002195 [Cercozoa sp. M6MM]
MSKKSSSSRSDRRRRADSRVVVSEMSVSHPPLPADETEVKTEFLENTGPRELRRYTPKRLRRVRSHRHCKKLSAKTRRAVRALKACHSNKHDKKEPTTPGWRRAKQESRQVDLQDVFSTDQPWRSYQSGKEEEEDEAVEWLDDDAAADDFSFDFGAARLERDMPSQPLERATHEIADEASAKSTPSTPSKSQSAQSAKSTSHSAQSAKATSQTPKATNFAPPQPRNLLSYSAIRRDVSSTSAHVDIDAFFADLPGSAPAQATPTQATPTQATLTQTRTQTLSQAATQAAPTSAPTPAAPTPTQTATRTATQTATQAATQTAPEAKRETPTQPQVAPPGMHPPVHAHTGPYMHAPHLTPQQHAMWVQQQHMMAMQMQHMAPRGHPHMHPVDARHHVAQAAQAAQAARVPHSVPTSDASLTQPVPHAVARRVMHARYHQYASRASPQRASRPQQPAEYKPPVRRN